MVLLIFQKDFQMSALEELEVEGHARRNVGMSLHVQSYRIKNNY
jgi:hypothetical protein